MHVHTTDTRLPFPLPLDPRYEGILHHSQEREPGNHCMRMSGTDPEILQRRWLRGWLLMINYAGARWVAG